MIVRNKILKLEEFQWNTKHWTVHIDMQLFTWQFYSLLVLLVIMVNKCRNNWINLKYWSFLQISSSKCQIVEKSEPEKCLEFTEYHSPGDSARKNKTFVCKTDSDSEDYVLEEWVLNGRLNATKNSAKNFNMVIRFFSTDLTMTNLVTRFGGFDVGSYERIEYCGTRESYFNSSFMNNWKQDESKSDSVNIHSFKSEICT